MLDICKRGGNAAVLDMNEEQGNLLVKELGSDTTRFFPCDVSDTESIAAAVKGVSKWVKQTGKPVGGIIPAAGVGRPGLVCNIPHSLTFLHPFLPFYLSTFLPYLNHHPDTLPHKHRIPIPIPIQRLTTNLPPRS